MTVSVQQPFIEYTADGVVTVFAYPFRVLEFSHLLIFLNQVQQGAGYVVDGINGPAGGNVIFSVAPAAGVKVLLLRRVARDQLVDYQPFDPFPAETHERALDKLTMMAQEAGSINDRSIVVPLLDLPANLVLPPVPLRANLFLSFDAFGNVQATGPGGTISHGTLLGLTFDDHPQYHNDARGDLRYLVIGSPHAMLTGLGADDHLQYHTDARGDARYILIGTPPIIPDPLIVNRAIIGDATDGFTPKLLVRGSARGVRIRTSAGEGFVEGVDQTGIAAFHPLSLGGSLLNFYTANLARWQIDPNGHLLLWNDLTYDIGSPVGRVRDIHSRNLFLGIGDSVSTSRGVVQIRDGGFAPPVAAGAVSDGDKLLMWNSGGVRIALGVDGGTFWFQSIASQGFKWYGGGVSPGGLLMQLDPFGDLLIGAIPNPTVGYKSLKLDGAIGGFIDILTAGVRRGLIFNDPTYDLRLEGSGKPLALGRNGHQPDVVIGQTGVASSNHVVLHGRSAGLIPVVGANSAAGGDADVGLGIVTKGTGPLRLFTGGTWDANEGVVTADEQARVEHVAGASSFVTLRGGHATIPATVQLPHGPAHPAPQDGQVWTTSAGLFARINGVTVGPLGTGGGGGATLGTPQIASGNTLFDFLGIPAGVKRITVSFVDLSTNGADRLSLAIGAGSFVASGYNCGVAALGGGAATVAAFTTDFAVTSALVAANVVNGQVVLALVSATSNLWTAVGNVHRSDGFVYTLAGSKPLSGALDRLRIVTSSGVNTFDSGAVNIVYD